MGKFRSNRTRVLKGRMYKIQGAGRAHLVVQKKSKRIDGEVGGLYKLLTEQVLL